MSAAYASFQRIRKACTAAACFMTILATFALSSCGPREDRRALVRRPLSPKTEDGWTRLTLDQEAQRNAIDPWIGDETGTPVPCLREHSGLWGPRQLDVERLHLGMDSEGRPSAEFSLRIPPSLGVRDREHLRIDLNLQGKTSWICRVNVSRQMEGPTFFGLPRESPIVLQDPGGKEAVASFLVPWDSKDYRVVLQALAGAAPTIRSLKVTAVTEPAAMEPDRVLVPAEVQCETGANAPERWRLHFKAVERVVGLEVLLKAPSAPVKPAVMLPSLDPKGGGPPRNLPSHDLLWNLPPKGGRGTRIALEPLLTDRLLLALPPGARLDAVKILVRNDVLLFPVRAGQRYWLHLGGKAKPAGEPGLLPPSRLIYGRDPVRMGPPEPDPQGLPKPIPPAKKAWLRQAALGGAAVLALLAGFLLWRRRED